MPLTFDLPLEELKNYAGSTPCPSDFDLFWNRSLEEVYLTEANVELVPSKFQSPYADCYNMFFTGTKNARIHAKLLKPKSITKTRACIVMVSWLWFSFLE